MARILVIDDDEGLRLLMATLLESDGHIVAAAANGKQGMALAGRLTFDLVVTDMVMPEMEGLETIMELRQKHPKTKIIAISGGGIGKASDYLDLAAKFGAHRIFTKPFSKDEFQFAVRGLLEHK